MSKPLDDRHTRLRNFAHPCAPARGPWRPPGTASTNCEQRGPRRARQGSWSHRGELSAGIAPRRVVRPLPARGQPRGGLGQPKGSEPLLQRRCCHSEAVNSSARRRQHELHRGQPLNSATRKTQRPRKGSRINEDGRRQQDVEPQRPRAERVDRQPPQPDPGKKTGLGSLHETGLQGLGARRPPAPTRGRTSNDDAAERARLHGLVRGEDRRVLVQEQALRYY